MVEQLPYKQTVGGSNPSGPTIESCALSADDEREGVAPPASVVGRSDAKLRGKVFATSAGKQRSFAVDSAHDLIGWTAKHSHKGLSMGWKALKDAFGIRHMVQVTSKGICIGSGYVHDIVTIEPATGKILENRAFPNALQDTYPALYAASAVELARLIAAPDAFAVAIPVYTYENGEILEKQCEEPGWPNVTHDGCMMYDNTFATDRDQVVAWAKRSAELAVQHMGDRIIEAERVLLELQERLAGYEAAQVKLEADYPAIHRAS